MAPLALLVTLAQTPPPLVPVPASVPAELARGSPFPDELTGAEIFLARCAACHGREGKGNGALGRGLGARNVTSKQWQDSRTDDQIRDAIMNGLPDTKMRAFRLLGTASQFEALVAFIRTLRAK